jgi:lysophospholipase L1-like esterase
MKLRSILPLFVLCWSAALHAADWKFDFTNGTPQPGFTRVAPDAAFDAQRGFGFEPVGGGAGKARLFSVNLGEGTYEVTMRFGDAGEATSTCVKAEARRLVIERVDTAPGGFETRTFAVNVRRPAISTGGEVKPTGSEVGANWDERLTLEFNGAQPGVASVEIKPAADALTVYLAGDSTVTDQGREPYAGWGQMLPRFFDSSVAVANHARSGLALFSFERQRRLAKILSTMRKGDYLFIQFGHNDQKDKSDGAGPFTTYKANLRKFIAATRAKGGIPVVVTPMERRRWSGGRMEQTLTDFAEAARQAAAEEKAPLIDLHAMSVKLYGALGPERSARAFLHHPANTFPGQPEAMKDDSHHSGYGGYELARCMVEGIRTAVPELAARIAKDAGTFDPAKPDAPESFALPLSPAAGSMEKPEGN